MVGQICHIYAASDDGPRGKPGLTNAERNAPGNLILMCGYHHPLVDKQWETYPAVTLFEWKRRHEAKFQQGTVEAIKSQEKAQQLGFTQALSDKEIYAEVERIRKGRFLNSFPTKLEAEKLAARVENTELSGGTKDARAYALAWCARLLSDPESQLRARELLGKSRLLTETVEATIAEAFIVAATDKNSALGMLAPINTPEARAAQMRIVTNVDKQEGALQWVKDAGLSIGSFDADGKLLHLVNEMNTEKWDDAKEDALRLSEKDFESSPVLFHMVGMCSLAQAVPEELRAFAVAQVPFEVSHFPLASDPASMKARRHAADCFEKASDFARSIGVVVAANGAADYALWLKLRDSRDHSSGMEELRESMRDSSQSLRRLHFALQFGVKLDRTAIEREIDRRMALSGGGTADEASARLALAFSQADPSSVAAYIAKHRTQLYKHLQKSLVQVIEIEMLARGGRVEAARERLAIAVSDELGQREQDHLQRIIAEAEGADPAAERKAAFELSGSLNDLVNLVDFLEQKEAWDQVYPFAVALFERTHALEDAFRIAKVLNESRKFKELHSFLLANRSFADQSIGLKTMLAWSLYRHGAFDEAATVLGELAAQRDDPTDRALRVGLAIASGNWDDIVEYCANEWNKRDQRTAAELLAAAELARAVGAPHAKDFILSAAAKGQDDPNILASAYFQATSAGWEQEAAAGNWLPRAAELSGDSGPLKSISMKELFDQKPDWDKRASSIWQQLNEGKIPAFGAAHMLNRSLTDFLLLPAFANLLENDTRRRNIVFAYSGARPAQSTHLDIVALELGAIFTLAQLDLLPTVLAAYRQVIIPNSTLGWLFEERGKVSFHQPSRIKDAHYLKRLVADGALKILPAPPLRDTALAKEVGIEIAGLLITVRTKSESGDCVPRFVVRSAPVHRPGSLMEEEADLSAYGDCLCSCQTVVEKLRAKGVLTLIEEQRALSYLKLHERRWPAEPSISDGAELYLDDLSTTYLRTVGILGKLKSAGLIGYIAEEEDVDANRLIAHESLSNRQLEAIDIIRRILADGLKSGQVIARRSKEMDEDSAVKSHPTFGVLGIEEPVDGFVVDDRFVNRHLYMDVEDRRTPILSTLDILDDLLRRALISRDAFFSHRTYLRQAGFQLVPITEEELIYHLGNAPLNGEAVVETAEMRAIRESLLRLQMGKIFQIPTEVPWLHQSMGSIIRTIRRIWKEKTNIEEAMAYSEWLVQFIDIRCWASAAMPGHERNFALFAYAAHIQTLTSPSEDVPDSVRDAYQNWVDERVVKEIKSTEPEMFAWMVTQARELIRAGVQDAIKNWDSE